MTEKDSDSPPPVQAVTQLDDSELELSSYFLLNLLTTILGPPLAKEVFSTITPLSGILIYRRALECTFAEGGN